uniref:LRC3 n=1 Tax=Griffithsia pacifica TaxID=35689 RepID=A0A291FEB8_GRIPA|nr:LRC3 [Griffithsia pacifica]5Y6P_a8 Chain a8, LRC3 [Griffithsia pacifica]5Y6P_a9 Chain a9, LRC3 [Griffithsia pacifica]
MAFVSATSVAVSTRATSLTGRSVSSSNAPPARTPTRPSPCMAIEFQTYSGGLDRVSLEPYSITRYLFKPAPATVTDGDKDVAINAGLRQLFGNAYIMEEERAEFYNAESKFRCGEITAREFARAVALSNAYRSRFFNTVSQYRFFELNFKHFLGRAPLNQVEYSKHFKIFAEGGYEAEINSYFDDPEYDEVFGDDCMPFTRFRGTYAPINQFNRMCVLEGGFAMSDKQRPVQLMTSLAANVPPAAYRVVDGLPAIPNAEHPTRKFELPNASLERFRNEVEVAKARELQLRVELKEAYAKRDEYRSGFAGFRAMAADMDISMLPGPRFQGRVENYPTWDGKSAPWGKSGVDTLSGVEKRPAKEIAKKEFQLERIKQLVVDLERRVAVLEAEREQPALTPEPLMFELEGLPQIVKEEEVVEEVTTPGTGVSELSADFDSTTMVTPDIDPESEDSGIVAPKTVEVETSRLAKDVGDLPGKLMKELEEKTKAEGKEFGGPKDGRLSFPGDGSEMVIGG